MNTSEYLSLFIEESVENLNSLNDILLELEVEPNDPAKVNEIFRIAHTLKGMSATMGFNTMAELTHKMEDVLAEFRNGRLKINKDIVTVLFRCLDVMEQMVNNISEGKNDEMEIKGIVDNLLLLMGVGNTEKTIDKADDENKAVKDKYNQYDLGVIKQALENGYYAFNIVIFLSENTLMKAARAFLILQALEEMGEVIKSVPGTDEIESGDFDFNISLVFITKTPEDKIHNCLLKMSEVDKVIIENIKPDTANIDVSQKNVQHVQDVQQKTSQEKSSVDKESANAKEVTQKRAHQSVRVELGRLDNFMNMVSELVIHRTRLEQLSKEHMIPEIHETIEQVGKTTSELQDLVLKIRMLPLEIVFSRFPRMVRDLSVDLGKEIEFIVEGQSIEIDRTVIDEIGEPLVHLIRNSVDHGIESKEARTSNGKSPVGKVRLSAHQEGAKVIILVEDDGAGIDIARVKAKAEKNGINTHGMNETELQNLIFHQGFSTKEEVTDISGRGVGLDVVKTKINSFGGTVDISSTYGEGSRFRISLPLNLQIIQALLVNIGSETMAVSLNYIDRVIDFKPEKIMKSNGNEVLIYNEKVIPLVRTNEKLGIKGSDSVKKYIAIVKLGEKTLGLLVDSLIGQQEIVIKPLGKTLSGMKNYIGATILGNGQVTLILDVGSLA